MRWVKVEGCPAVKPGHECSWSVMTGGQYCSILTHTVHYIVFIT